MPDAISHGFFSERGLAALRDIARVPAPTLDELKQLHQQVANAISAIELGLMVEMTPEERQTYANRFGYGTFVIGDFAIKRTLDQAKEGE